MCRWLAYAGPSIEIGTLLFKPTNSLARQSQAARRTVYTTNGDGFGVGWYGDRPNPGLYRDIMPAWNDSNLRSLAEQIRSRLFVAHVRASTGTSVSRENCHPFRYGNWLFVHNGLIGGYRDLRARIDRMIAPELYQHRLGSTDSEAFVYMLVGRGLAEDPTGAFARTVADICGVIDEAASGEPFHMAAVATDGHRLIALRCSNDANSPSLYYAQGGEIGVREGRMHFSDGHGAVLVASEPLDHDDLGWTEVPDAHFLIAQGGSITVVPLDSPSPAAAA